MHAQLNLINLGTNSSIIYMLCFNGQPLPAIRMSSANVIISATHHMTISRIHVHVIVRMNRRPHLDRKHVHKSPEDGTKMSVDEYYLLLA